MISQLELDKSLVWFKLVQLAYVYAQYASLAILI